MLLTSFCSLMKVEPFLDMLWQAHHDLNRSPMIPSTAYDDLVTSISLLPQQNGQTSIPAHHQMQHEAVVPQVRCLVTCVTQINCASQCNR